MTPRAEVLTRYRNLREISKRHHSAVLNFPGQGCDHFPGSAHRPGSIDKMREVWPRLSSDEKKLFDVIARAYLAVAAVEPSGAMCTEARGCILCRGSDGCRILCLASTRCRLGLSFDLILLSAVWMHVPPADRTRAFRKLVMLLAVTQAEIERLARAHGAFVEKATDSKDELGRRAVNWT
jgi:hypothetical protein